MVFTESSIQTISRSQELLLTECPQGSDAYTYFNHQALIAIHSSLTHEQFILARTVITLALMSHEETSLNPQFILDTDFLGYSSSSSIYDKAKRNVSHNAWIIIRILDDYEKTYYLDDETPLSPSQYADIYLNFYRLRQKMQSCRNREESYSVIENEVDSFDFDQIKDIEEITINKFALLIALVYIRTGRFLTPEQDYDLFAHPRYFYRYTLQRLGRRSSQIIRRFDINFLKSVIIRNKPFNFTPERYINTLRSRFHKNILKKSRGPGLDTELFEEINLVEQALFEARFDLLETHRSCLEQRFAYYCM